MKFIVKIIIKILLISLILISLSVFGTISYIAVWITALWRWSCDDKDCMKIVHDSHEDVKETFLELIEIIKR